MLHSTYHHKDTNEDPKTSAVFENLMLLPDNIFWEMIKRSCFDGVSLPKTSGDLRNYQFWCHWDNEGTTNSVYVEPDLFLQFDNFDVIIEAKYGDMGGQYQQQWKNEIISYHNEHGKEKPFIFIAVGGNSDLQTEHIKVCNQKVPIYKCSWTAILISVSKYLEELESLSFMDYSVNSIKRILKNIILAFNINGVYDIKWFDDMRTTYPTINEQSIILFENNFHYE